MSLFWMTVVTALRALRFHPRGTGHETPDANAKEGSAVYVLEPGGTLRRVEVEVGVRDNQHVEVLSGDLHEGDQIAVSLRREGPDAASTPRRLGFHGLKKL